MKTSTKALLTLACALLLVAASVMGTLAYLTSTDEVKNTFSVGKVAIKLDEAKVGTDGKALTGNDAQRVKENGYKLMPGHLYDKDPTVTVLAGSEESYIKMVVTVNKRAELDEIFKDHNIIDLTTVIGGYDKDNWLLGNRVTVDETANTRTYEFWYKETVTASTADVVLDDLFETITVPGNLTNEELETLQYKFTTDEETGNVTKTEDPLVITVKAYAIQKDGFANADAAWAAFSA